MIRDIGRPTHNSIRHCCCILLVLAMLFGMVGHPYAIHASNETRTGTEEGASGADTQTDGDSVNTPQEPSAEGNSDQGSGDPAGAPSDGGSGAGAPASQGNTTHEEGGITPVGGGAEENSSGESTPAGQDNTTLEGNGSAPVGQENTSGGDAPGNSTNDTAGEPGGTPAMGPANGTNATSNTTDDSTGNSTDNTTDNSTDNTTNDTAQAGQRKYVRRGLEDAERYLGAYGVREMEPLGGAAPESLDMSAEVFVYLPIRVTVPGWEIRATDRFDFRIESDDLALDAAVSAPYITGISGGDTAGIEAGPIRIGLSDLTEETVRYRGAGEDAGAALKAATIRYWRAPQLRVTSRLEAVYVDSDSAGDFFAALDGYRCLYADGGGNRVYTDGTSLFRFTGFSERDVYLDESWRAEKPGSYRSYPLIRRGGDLYDRGVLLVENIGSGGADVYLRDLSGGDVINIYTGPAGEMVLGELAAEQGFMLMGPGASAVFTEVSPAGSDAVYAESVTLDATNSAHSALLETLSGMGAAAEGSFYARSIRLAVRQEAPERSDAYVRDPQVYTYEISAYWDQRQNLIRIGDPQSAARRANALLRGAPTDRLGEALFTNGAETYQLVLSNHVYGNMGSRTKAFDVVVSVWREESGQRVYTDLSAAGGTGNGDGTYTFALTHEGEVTITGGLEEGLFYSVRQKDYSDEEYVTTVNGEAGYSITGPMAAEVSVRLTNTRDKTVPTGVRVPDAAEPLAALAPAALLMAVMLALAAIKRRALWRERG